MTRARRAGGSASEYESALRWPDRVLTMADAKDLAALLDGTVNGHAVLDRGRDGPKEERRSGQTERKERDGTHFSSRMS